MDRKGCLTLPQDADRRSDRHFGADFGRGQSQPGKAPREQRISRLEPFAQRFCPIGRCLHHMAHCRGPERPMRRQPHSRLRPGNDGFAIKPQRRSPLPPLRAKTIAIVQIDLVITGALGDLAHEFRISAIAPKV